MLDFHGYGWVFWAGTKITLLVGLSAAPVVLALGLLGAWGKLAGNPIARSLAGFYTTIVRGVPEFVLILLVYYGITILVQHLLSLATGGEVLVDIDPFTAGTLDARRHLWRVRDRGVPRRLPGARSRPDRGRPALAA